VSTPQSNIGDRMRLVRNETGFSQAKVAAMLDLSDRAYKTYELGKREPSLSTVLKFCEIFEVDLVWLINGGLRTEQDQADLATIATRTADAVYRQIMNDDPKMTAPQFQKFFAYVLEQAVHNKAVPEEEAKKIHQIFTGKNGET
jgi:transcriptional regulator with XRE-family HTH domain